MFFRRLVPILPLVYLVPLSPRPCPPTGPSEGVQTKEKIKKNKLNFIYIQAILTCSLLIFGLSLQAQTPQKKKFIFTDINKDTIIADTKILTDIIDTSFLKNNLSIAQFIHRASDGTRYAMKISAIKKITINVYELKAWIGYINYQTGIISPPGNCYYRMTLKKTEDGYKVDTIELNNCDI